MSGKTASTPLFAMEVRSPHRIDLHLEHLLYRVPDFDLGSFRGNFKYELTGSCFFLARTLVLCRLRIKFFRALSLLGNHGPADDLVSRLH